VVVVVVAGFGLVRGARVVLVVTAGVDVDDVDVARVVVELWCVVVDDLLPPLHAAPDNTANTHPAVSANARPRGPIRRSA
jgi:ribosomal protein L12E/L44/L45/RPP1/RPP2